MKYLFVLFIALASVSAFFSEAAICADNETASTAPANAAAVVPYEEILRMTGPIDLISSSQIIIKDEEGIGTLFAIDDNTPIIDKKGEKTTATWVSRGSQACVTYKIDSGGIKKVVQSIKILPD